MEYAVIQPPFTLDFRNMSSKEAREYFKWFAKQTPKRIAIVERAVRSTPGYETWHADFTRDSLRILGTWFYSHIETRPRTPEEKEEIYRNAPGWFRVVEIGDWELTNRTFSLAMDIGMYVSQVFLKEFPSLKMEMITEPTVDYQQPALIGFEGNIYFNPVRMLVTHASGLADNTWGPTGLVELYEIWTKRVK